MDGLSMQTGSVEHFIGALRQYPGLAKSIPAEVYCSFIKVDHCQPDTVTTRIKYAARFIEQAFACRRVSQQGIRYCHENGCLAGFIRHVQRFERRFGQRRELESVRVHVQLQIDFSSVKIAERHVPSIFSSAIFALTCASPSRAAVYRPCMKCR